MNLLERAAKHLSRMALCWLALLLSSGLPLVAQNSSAPASTTVLAINPAVAGVHTTIALDGPWRFQVGDDPRWADPRFDDSSWQNVTLSQPLTEQGFDAYSGYGWYRLRLQPQQLALLSNASSNPALNLMVSSNSVGQLAVYVDGVESGHTKGMTERPSMYMSPPLVVPLPHTGSDGTIEIAIRTWAGDGISIGRGLLDKVELGAPADIADRRGVATDRLWDRQLIAGLAVSFLFLCVGLLGMVLYRAQRKHSEYLWLGLLCLNVALMGASESAWALEMLPWSVFRISSLWAGRIFMAVTLEFVLRFTGSEYRKLVRVFQGIVLLLPILSLVHLQLAYEYVSVSSEVAFSVLMIVMLFRAWRKGRPDSGVLLVPFFLAATANNIDTIIDYAAWKHWINSQFAFHTVHVGPIEFPISTASYMIFLFSLLAVIFYRFIHVSQEEQRTSAEIDAARSVQAMLIPTELPSNHSFMLESAYLPANGVGGDFFQVLPLKDDSMLIVVGDVSGKGLQAAMNASTLVGALRNELSHDPAVVLNRLNNVLLGATQGQGALPNLKGAVSFATCVCARVYPDGTMTIANAGHLHPYRDGRELELAADLPLGVIPDIQYAQATFQLTVGDRLIFLSDGVVEAANAQGELFGFERTQQVSNESARYIAQTAKHFGQNDDITVVSLYFAARARVHAPDRVPQQV